MLSFTLFIQCFIDFFFILFHGEEAEKVDDCIDDNEYGQDCGNQRQKIVGIPANEAGTDNNDQAAYTVNGCC